MNSASTCNMCQAAAVVQLLDFGKQALCNRYLTNPQEDEVCFDFLLGQCGACGLIQVIRPVPPVELKSRFDWILYNEQEGHLDHLVETISKLRGLTVASRIGAISFKDDTTIARLRKKGFTETWRIDLEKDLGISDRFASLETIQARLSPEYAEAIAQRRGSCDVLIIRHVLEHAHNPRRFASALKRLVTPGGYLVFEAPDCQPALAHKDYSMPWEEHIVYFTPETFRRSLAVLAFSEVYSESYHYSNENSLVAIVQNCGEAQPVGLSTDVLERQKLLGRSYADGFPLYCEKVSRALAMYQKNCGKIVVFGAGHLSCFWINALGINNYIECIIDDHPKKRGLFMPGSRLPICGASALLEKSIKLCLLSLSPESEERVIRNNHLFIEHGGAFSSIFPNSKHALLI